MIVVSNTSPIINLAAIGRLELLKQMFQHVLLPAAVRDEIVVRGAGQPGAVGVVESDWIEARTSTHRSLIVALCRDMDRGEAEAIALASELQADLLLMDERIGRRGARQQGLRVSGVIGILIEAKAMGKIDLVQPLLDDLRARAGFWGGESLYKEALEAAGE